MIPQDYVEEWRSEAPWQTLRMIEQDLIITRVLVELYQQETIANSLVFRGGTALNKLYIRPPARYSEDIDLVQINSEPIGKTITAIRNALDHWLGEPKRKITARCVKLIYYYQSVDQVPAKLKIEINTTEHYHLLELKKLEFQLKSEWFSNTALILTYQLDELMGSKLRALYQRRKGRDLFDLWLVLSRKLVNVDSVIEVFIQHCRNSDGVITRAMFEKNLNEKKQHNDFALDLGNLLTQSVNWNFSEAAQLVEDKLISHLTGEPWKSRNDREKSERSLEFEKY